MPPMIFDKTGKPQTLDWLRANYGAVDYTLTPRPGWALVEIREDADLDKRESDPRVMPRNPDAAAVLMVKVQDKDGQPVQGLHVARWWPDPTLSPLPPDLATYHSIGVHGPTNEMGDVGFGMGRGDAYTPPSAGASEIWLPGVSDIFRGLGWLAGTNHYHLNLTFRWIDDDGAEPPPDFPVDEIRKHAQAILDLLSVLRTA